jgi:hypothetical protein
MKLIKRCYGCGKLLYPWQDIVRTKLVGKIHRGCAFGAHIKYYCTMVIDERVRDANEEALKALNKEVNT